MTHKLVAKVNKGKEIEDKTFEKKIKSYANDPTLNDHIGLSCDLFIYWLVIKKGGDWLVIQSQHPTITILQVQSKRSRWSFVHYAFLEVQMADKATHLIMPIDVANYYDCWMEKQLQDSSIKVPLELQKQFQDSSIKVPLQLQNLQISRQYVS